MAFATFFVSRPIANVCPTLQSPVGNGFVADVGHMGQLKNVCVCSSGFGGKNSF